MVEDFTPKRLRANGLHLAYRDVGPGPETVVFSHSYLVDSRQFEAQMAALATTHRVIAYDHRDHGGSDRAEGPYGLYDLVGDGERVIEALDAAPCHWVGLSAGGFVGMRIALRHPEWLRSLTLMDTSATGEELFAKVRGRAMLTTLRLTGTRPLARPAMKLMFGDPFLEDPTVEQQRDAWRDRILANDPQALIRFGNAILSRDDVLEALGALHVPLHVITGEQDRGLPVRHAEAIARVVPGATLSCIEGAGHLCTIERPTEVNDALIPFITAHGAATDERA